MLNTAHYAVDVVYNQPPTARRAAREILRAVEPKPKLFIYNLDDKRAEALAQLKCKAHAVKLAEATGLALEVYRGAHF